MTANDLSICDVNILTKYPKKGDLLNYLNNLHHALSVTTQEVSDRPKGLKSISKQLVSSKLLAYNDKDVRLLTTCCIADILRVFAPEAPYNNEDTILAFNAINTQIRGLATYDSMESILSSKVFYILNSIATVQSCVVPVILAQSGVHGAADTVINMFDAILSSIRTEHPEEVFASTASVLQACIEECEGVGEDLLDILLLPLLPHSKLDNPAAYQVAGTVLRRVANSIKSPITAFINRILVGASHEYAVQGSDLREHVYSLIYELHRVSADLLHGVLPNVCLQLQVEELDVRLRAVKVLSSLFASTYADYAKEFARNFKEYLGRLNDISIDIRLEVVESCAVIVQNKPSLLSLIEEPLVKRLRDADERVRLAALTKLIDLCYFGPKEFSTHTFLEMGERVKDRRMEVKRLAMIGLAKIYNKHISSTLPPMRSLVGSSSSSSHQHSMRSLVDQSLLDRLDFIPGFLMKCWSYPEAINKYLIVQLLQEQLLPKQSAVSSTDGGPPQGTEKVPAVAAVVVVSKSSKNKSSVTAESKSGPESSDICDRRATAFVLMFELLTKSDRTFLASIMTFKAKVRSELLTFMSIRSKSLGPVDSRSSQTQQTLIERRMSSHPQLSSILSTEDSVKLLRTCIVKIMQLIPAADKKATYLEKLYSVKDRVVFRLLDHCINAEDSIALSIRNREELKKRLDSKSPMGEYMGTLYDIAGSLVVNRTSVQSLLHFLTQLSISPDALVPSELLVFLSKHSSHAFQGEGGVDSLTDWFVHLMDDIKTKYKDTRALLSMHCLSVINFTCQAFEFEDEHQFQLCASIIAQIKKNTSPETCVKLAELCSQMAYYSQPDGYGKGQGESSLSLIETLFDALSANKGLSKNNKRLDSDLGALSALCSVPKAAYIALNFTKPSLLSFMSKVISKRNSIVEFTKGILYRAEGSVEESVSVYTLGVCLRLLTNVLSTEEEWHHLQGSSSSGGSRRPPTHSDFKALVTLLFECIDSKGQQLHNYSIAARVDQDYLFETASDCAVSMIKLNAFAVETTVDQWHALGWTFLHPDENIRSRLLGTLTTTIQLYFVHSKFLTYPCLFVSDEALYPIAQQALTVNVKRLRISYDELCTLQIEDSGARVIQKQTESCMPEAILPYLLHLLSYHPDFPTSISIDTDVDKKRMMSVVRSVRMLLEVLQSTLTVDSDNMSYLFKQLNSINQHYVDKHDSDNIGLHFVTRLAVKHLHEQIKTSDNLQVYPGDIVLPRQLYKLKSSQGHTSSDDQASNVEEILQTKEGLEDAENAIDKVLQFANRSRGARNATGGSRRTATSHKDDLVGSGSKPRNSKKRLSDNSISSISPHDLDALQDQKKRQPTTAEKGKRQQQQSWSGEKIGRDERSQEGSHSASKSKLPVEAPTRNMPKRGAKEVVTSYAIPTESDREMLRWEEDAARTKRPKSSELHLLQGYSGTTAQVDIRRLSSGVVNRSSSSSAGVILMEDDSISRAEERGITDRELTESQESAAAPPTKASANNTVAINKSNGTKDKRARSSKGGDKKQNPAVASRRTRT